MDFLSLADNELNFWNNWNSYIANNLSSFRYLENYVKFMKCYSPYISKDLSFLIIENNKTVGICFLPIEEINGVKSITLGGSYTVGPLAKNEKVERLIFQKIEEIANSEKIEIIKFYSEPLVEVYSEQYNPFRKYGFLDCSSTDMLISLTPDASLLWSNLRKSYKSLINGILKNSDYKIVFMDKSNADYSINEQYRHLHIKTSGRETRSKETFDLQFELVKAGNAFVTALAFKEKFISFNYFLHQQKSAIYMSAADDPDYTSSGLPYFHATLWASLGYLKEKGFEYLQMSSPASSTAVEGFLDYSEDKQLDIAFFKKGMGAERVPFNRGIRYYTQDLFLRDLDIFKKNVLDHHIKK